MTKPTDEIAAGRADMIRLFFDHSRDLLHVVDGEGRLQLVNAPWCELSGLTERQLIGRSIDHFIHPADLHNVLVKISAMQVGDVVHDESRMRLASGEWRWFAVRCQKIGDDLFIGSMRDATQERARADELEIARRTRKLLGASAGIGIWSYEPLDQRVECSEEMLALLGRDVRADDSAMAFRELVHPDDLRRFSRDIGRSVRTGEPGRLEHRVKSREGWITLRTTYHTERRSGGVHAIRAISQDITELVEAREDARRGEGRMREARREAINNARRLKLALEAAEAGVYEIDHASQTFWASPDFHKLTGRRDSSYAEAIAVDYPGFHPDDLPHVRASFEAVRAEGGRTAHSFEARLLVADGEPRWVRVLHQVKVGKNGRVLKSIGLIHDFHARKLQELELIAAQRAAEAGAEAKAAFLANMSHEIRTPMNGVMGVLHLLKGEAISGEGRALLDEALNCGQMLAELLNDVIDFSKIEAGRLELAYEPLEPRAVIEGVARLLGPQAEAAGLRLHTTTDPAVGWVRSDPVRLRQALFNLVGNAVKFTERGSVSVRCGPASAPGRLRFEVQDTGVGIPLEAQGRIFQRFDQGDASTTRKFGGSGLGLAITKRLAEMMDGDVGFTSTPGAGSTFWLEIAAAPAQAPAEPATARAQVLQGLRVLVVEDNATNRMIATKLLEQLGASVETAADGYLGVEAAPRGFDLILMDVQMPGIDGVEAARRIRALGGAAARTPIVALTANVMSHQRQAYLDAGMDGVVGKPIAPAALIAEIARLGDPEGAEAGEAAAGAAAFG